MDKLLLSQIQKYEKDIIRFLQELVKIPSYEKTGINQTADFVHQVIQSLDYETHLIGRGGSYSVVYYPQRKTGKSVWLSAPLDTAHISEASLWKYPPLGGVIKNNWLYGRGSADSKVAIAYFIYGVKALQEVYPELPGKIVISFDAGEHSGDFSGLREILNQGVKADVCMLGYPGNEVIGIGARGFVRFKVTFIGQSAHTGSRKNDGINSILHANQFINDIQKLKLKFTDNPLFPFGPKITVSMINGGKAINVIPDNCEVFLDIRTVPGQENKIVKEQILGVLSSLEKELPDLKYKLEVLNGEPAFVSDQEHQMIQIFQNNAENIYHKEIPLGVFGPANDGNVIHQKLKIPIMCGFGCQFKNIHGSNECVYLPDIVPTTYTFMHSIKDYLTAPKV